MKIYRLFFKRKIERIAIVTNTTTIKVLEGKLLISDMRDEVVPFKTLEKDEVPELDG
ncbi:hypothetical protein [Sulfuracidifex tepidarius]|uniref:hypothetical protein n=1 Tax=Sulfuracidifex tepidarius TaxID=1294262 RepID=UPI00210871BD|nr:hypothetical protein [Sulfuracidifex tepidarius]